MHFDSVMKNCHFMDELLNIRECFSLHLTFQSLENGGRGGHNVMVNKRNECDGCKIMSN